MKAEELMDAIGLLDEDLITAADKCRTPSKPGAIHWKRWSALAACVALMLGMVYQSGLFTQKTDSIRLESAAAPQAPEAMQEEMKDGIADLSEPEEPEFPAAVPESEETPMRDDHSHSFAPETQAGHANGHRGDAEVIIRIDDQEYTLSGSGAAAITDILTGLSYDPNAVCGCNASIQVDTESLIGFSINLGEGFARCEHGQASLTQTQARQIREIIDKLP